MFWRPSACNEVESILTGTVEEVVLQISQGRLVHIIKCTLLRALPSPSEIGLEGASSTVCPGDGIRMLRPDYANGLRRMEGVSVEGIYLLGRPLTAPHGHLQFHSRQTGPHHAIAL